MPNHPPNPEVRLLDGEWYASRPWQQLRWLRDHAPVYWDESSALWGITRHEDIMHVSKTPELFCSGKSSRPERDTCNSMSRLFGPCLAARKN